MNEVKNSHRDGRKGADPSQTAHQIGQKLRKIAQKLGKATAKTLKKAGIATARGLKRFGRATAAGGKAFATSISSGSQPVKNPSRDPNFTKTELKTEQNPKSAVPKPENQPTNTEITQVETSEVAPETAPNPLPDPLDTLISGLVIPKDEIVFVKDSEVLGPLTLDHLYRSGFNHFPIVNGHDKIIGTLHTASLNSLEVKESFTAHQLLDPSVFYVREDYSIRQALNVFLRTEAAFCLVVNKFGKITGMLNFSDLCETIFGHLDDGFELDSDKLAVAKRSFSGE